MVANRKVTGTALSMPAGLALGLLISVGITAAGAAILAWLISRETLPETAIGYGSMVILLLASIFGALVSVKRIKRRRLVVCLLSGVSYFLLLLASTALFFGGQYSGIGVTALVILAGCGAVGLLGLRGEGKPARRMRKYASR